MNEMQASAFKRATNILKALNCQYAIITPEGEKLGELELYQKPETIKTQKGDYKKHVEKFLHNVQVGQDFSVPCDEYRQSSIAMAVDNYFRKRYGKGSLNYKTNTLNNSIDGIRIN